MLRILLIVALVGYVLYKLGLFRGLLNPSARDPRAGRSFRRPADGNVNIDSVPGDKHRTGQSGRKGGEYVDYEEIK